MRICIPTETDKGKSAMVFDHFGSAPFFTIYDDQDDSFEIVNNDDQHHVHGACNPLSLLAEKKIEAIVCRGMGARAMQRLNHEGIRVYLSEDDSVDQVVQGYRDNKLKEMTVDTCCAGHGCH